MATRRMVPNSSALASLVLLLAAGCADDGQSEAGTSSGITASAGTSGETGSATMGSATTSSTTNTGDGDGDPTTTTTSSSTTNGDGDGDPATGDGDGDGEGSTSEGLKFDVGGIPDGLVDCQCGTTLDFSYIWIANTNESTVTKLNTETMEEEGRYLTRADGNGSPSRTSVALSGRAVAVANRNGGLVKVNTLEEDCDPMKNGQPGIQTSTDSNFLPWGQDDCVDWFVPFNYTTQRPVAWAPGILDEGTCTYSNEKVWTAGCNTGQHQWAQVHLVDGDTGEIEMSVDVVGFECSSLSPYGGAVNADGDLWFTNLVPGNDRLARVDRDTGDFQVWNMPITPYGMTVDQDGNPWIAAWAASQNASAAKFDVQTEEWSFANNHVAYSLSGIQQDAEGRMWMNYWQYDGQNLGTGGLVYIDMETMEVSEPYDLGCQSSTCRGMSIDLNGMVWSTSQATNKAFRLNPETMEVVTYDNLNGPYTYSDMTGWGIQSAACGPQG